MNRGVQVAGSRASQLRRIQRVVPDLRSVGERRNEAQRGLARQQVVVRRPDRPLVLWRLRQLRVQLGDAGGLIAHTGWGPPAPGTIAVDGQTLVPSARRL